jgi:hypothetical protein
MNVDHEFGAWRTAWLAQEKSLDPAKRLDLRKMVERQSRWMAVQLALQLLFGLALLAFATFIAVRRPSIEWIVWAAVIWILTFGTAGFVVWNSLGLWRSVDQSIASFVALSRQRCLAALRAVRFGCWLVAVELIIVGLWLLWNYAARHDTPGFTPANHIMAAVLAGGLAIGCLAWFSWQRRRKLDELERLEAFQRTLAQDSQNDTPDRGQMNV